MAKDLSHRTPQADYATKKANLTEKLGRHRAKIEYMQRRDAEIVAAIQHCTDMLAQGKVGPE